MKRMVKREIELPARTLDSWDTLRDLEALLHDVAKRWGQKYSIEVTDDAGMVFGDSLEEAWPEIAKGKHVVDVVMRVGEGMESRQIIAHLMRGFEKPFKVTGTSVEEADAILASVITIAGDAAAEQAESQRQRELALAREQEERRREERRTRVRCWFARHAEAIVVGAIGSVLGALAYALVTGT